MHTSLNATTNPTNTRRNTQPLTTAQPLATFTNTVNAGVFTNTTNPNMQQLLQLIQMLLQQLLAQMNPQQQPAGQTATPQGQTTQAAPKPSTPTPAPVATTKPATTTAAQPVSAATTKPATTTTAQPAPVPVATTKPATTIAAQPAPVATTKPATTTAVQPAPAATTKPATTTTAQPAPAATTKPATTVIQPTPAKTDAKQVIDIYLLGGQSNAVGLGATRLEKALEETLGADTATHKTQVFSHAVGATNLHTQWAADGTASAQKDGSLYQEFQSKLKAYVAQVQKSAPDAQINIAGMFWHQGESDALSTVPQQQAYDENLTRFIEDVRATTGVADLPFMIGRLSDKQTNMTATALKTIQQAQDTVDAADARTVGVRMETAEHAGIHFTEKGYDTMATLFATAFRDNFA